MSQNQNQHSKQVVASFKSKLSADVVAQIGEENFGALELIVESAMSTAVLEELEKAADKVEVLAHDIRSFAEHYDR
ncbi:MULTISPECIES: phosphatase [Neptunomonas]|uniref:Phosphatase n=1 Tax=Neptunomonas marina TaxID=1815562 RepID=A0A437Q859_9GAMM|nr:MULTISPECIES: phosphatase [Neptunomonas]RVU30735.1 phosphatase [Neptunomonas marina]